MAVLACNEAHFWWFVLGFFVWWDDLQNNFFGCYVWSPVDGNNPFDFPLDIVGCGHEGWASACRYGYCELKALGDAVCKVDGLVAGWFCLIEDAVFGYLPADDHFERGVILGFHDLRGFGAFDFAADFVCLDFFMRRNCDSSFYVFA